MPRHYTRNQIRQYLGHYFRLGGIRLMWDKGRKPWELIEANELERRRSRSSAIQAAFVKDTIIRADLDRAIHSLAPTYHWYIVAKILQILYDKNHDVQADSVAVNMSPIQKVVFYSFILNPRSSDQPLVDIEAMALTEMMRFLNREEKQGL